MVKIDKIFTLVLIGAVALWSLTLLVNAQTVTPPSSIPEPSAPQFTLRFIDQSYDVPATYTTDPYNGTQILQSPAHHVYNGTIEVQITNSQYTYSNGSTFHVYYDVRTKGHFAQNWTYLYSAEIMPELISSNSAYIYGQFIFTMPMQSASAYTIISLPDGIAESNPYPPNAQVDYSVQAIVGHDSKYYVNNNPYQPNIAGYYSGVAYDTSSDWSPTQTVAITYGSNSSPTPSVPELPWLVVLPLFVVAVISLLIYRRHRKTAPNNR